MIETIGEWFTGPSRTELHRKIDRLEEKLEDQKDIVRSLRRQLDTEKEKKVMANGAELCGVLPLDTVCPFYVKETRPNNEKEYFVAKGGRKTYEETLNVAQRLAAEFPQNTYSVVGVLATVKAEIPIATTVVAKPVAQEKVDTEKKD